VNTPRNKEDEGRPRATILNVNDHAPTLYLNSLLLKQAGYQVVEALSGMEALRLASGLPDLVLLDVHLPDIDGYEVCRRLRAREETRDLVTSPTCPRCPSPGRTGSAAWPRARTRTGPRPSRTRNCSPTSRRCCGSSHGPRTPSARDAFLSIAAHDLKTPITVLRLNLEPALDLTTRDPDEPLSRSGLQKSLVPSLRACWRTWRA
jgi:hypothetical protein